MTTQVPYPQPQHPPAPAYPTAPPWATATPADPALPPPAEEAVPDGLTPWGAPYEEHGQLLVPYPEEMHRAARAEPPSWWPVVGWTALFGVLGAIAAVRRSGQARRGRNSPAPYWVAFALTLAVMTVLSGIVAAVGVPAYLAARESAVTKVVQENIRTDGQLEQALHTTARTATCEPISERTGGQRRYSCVVSLADGRTGTLTVTGDRDGNWTPGTGVGG
ncbi:MAG TPA: hypothetical protein VFH03_13390 [Actinoplanes sp.]|nr:hypothetical protein [Actinoplanes sp.]